MVVKSPKKKPMSPTSLVGQTLGKYRIVEPLGRGGMAQVYKAYHPSLDRYAAVKVLRSDLVEEAEFLARFQREARAVAALRHPNIVQVFDFDVHDDLYYMVMELLEGNTLKAYQNAFRTKMLRLPVSDMVRILMDVLSGLEYAHREGVVHRDLKPANIMLTRRGQAVLTDFGIAQIVGATQYTVSGALMGTLTYMAPEQGLEGKCDTRSDIYSLGIVFYEMLTGSVPFDADTPLAILMKHVNDPLPLPCKVDPSIPESFERLALKALAKDPDDRYQSCKEMKHALQGAAQIAGIDPPEHITISEPDLIGAPTQRHVAIFSGEDRQKITDTGFAADDTEGIISRAQTGKPQRPTKKGSRAALVAVTIIIFSNMFMLWASGVFGWTVFARTWPMELVVVGVLFIAMMVEHANPWLLIPGGILLGNGLVLAYFSLTGRWSDWSYLWPLEPLIIAAAIITPFWLTRRTDSGRDFIRWFGIILLALAGITFVFSLAVAILRP